MPPTLPLGGYRQRLSDGAPRRGLVDGDAQESPGAGFDHESRRANELARSIEAHADHVNEQVGALEMIHQPPGGRRQVMEIAQRAGELLVEHTNHAKPALCMQGTRSETENDNDNERE